jgi:hypothetical protein
MAAPILRQNELLCHLLKDTSMHRRTVRMKERERKHRIEWLRIKRSQGRKTPSLSLQSATGSLRGGGTDLLGCLNREFEKGESSSKMLETKLNNLAAAMQERLGFVSKKEKVINMLKQFVNHGFVDSLLSNANEEFERGQSERKKRRNRHVSISSSEDSD